MITPASISTSATHHGSFHRWIFGTESVPRPWTWALVALLCHLVFCLGMAINSPPATVSAIAMITGAVFGSTFPVWLLVLAMVGRGRWGQVLRWLSWTILILVHVWHIASFVRYADQGEGLSWFELWSSLQEPQVRNFMLSVVVSWRMVGFLVAVGLLAGMTWLMVRRVSSPIALGTVLFFLIVGVIAQVLVSSSIRWSAQQTVYLHTQVKPALAPWSTVHQAVPNSGATWSIAIQETKNPDLDVAKELATTASGWEWASPGNAELSELRGLYAGRDILIVLLESHRLADVAPFGQGASSHQDLSPNLSRLATNSWWFSNCIQAGQGSIWAMYGLLSGVTPPVYLTNDKGAGAKGGNRIPAVGPLRRFIDLGYECDMVVGCEYSFWDIAGLLTHSGVTGPWSDEERALVKDSPQSEWGYDDEAIYQITLRRLLSQRPAGRPRVQIVKSSSNHQPFLFRQRPGEPPLPRDHIGGMQYADRCFGTFINAVHAGTKGKEPLIFVIADHTHAQRLEKSAPLYRLGAEGFRIPGLLWLPDGRLAGRTSDMLLSHHDVLSLLLTLVDDRQAPTDQPRKFIDRQRIALAFEQSSGYGIITADHYRPNWRVQDQAVIYRFESPWKLVQDDDPLINRQMDEFHTKALVEHDRLWSLQNSADDPTKNMGLAGVKARARNGGK